MHKRVAERLRVTAPTHLGAIPGSLPVVSFGDFLSPKVGVATIALNPSSREFWSSTGKWLSPAKTRLASRHSLGIAADAALSNADLEAVVRMSNGYFEGNPLRDWFKPLNDVLVDACAADFWAGTACHLDLVQWATHPVQNKLGDRWPQLVEGDREFLRWQIEATPASTIVLNGAGVMRELTRAGVTSEPDVTEFKFTSRQGSAWRLRVFSAEAQGKTVVGWNQVIARHRSWPAGARATLIEELRRILGGAARTPEHGAPASSKGKHQPVGWNVVARDHMGEIAFSGIVTWEQRQQIKALREELLEVVATPLEALPAQDT